MRRQRARIGSYFTPVRLEAAGAAATHVLFTMTAFANSNIISFNDAVTYCSKRDLFMTLRPFSMAG